jgi:hypothetical protein
MSPRDRQNVTPILDARGQRISARAQRRAELEDQPTQPTRESLDQRRMVSLERSVLDAGDAVDDLHEKWDAFQNAVLDGLRTTNIRIDDAVQELKTAAQQMRTTGWPLRYVRFVSFLVFVLVACEFWATFHR